MKLYVSSPIALSEMNHPTTFYSLRLGGARLGPASMFLMLALILLATLLRGGNRSVALIALEWLALALALALAAQWLGGASVQRTVSIADLGALGLLVLGPAWLPVMQLAAGRFQVPSASAFSILAGVPMAVSMLAALSADAHQAATVRKTWLSVALSQAAFGLTQLSGAEALHFGLSTLEPVIGTYASKNTFANLLVMAIPLAVWQFVDGLSGIDSAHGVRRDRNRKSLLGWGAAIFLLIVTVMLTTSRTGIVTGLLVFVLSVVLLAPRRSQSRWSAWGWSAGAVALVVVALLAGGLDWASRFDAERLASDYDFRASMRSAAAGAAWNGLPLGSGLGSFAWVSAGFQPVEAGRFWFDLAHNDYMQLLTETGLAGALLIVAAFWLFLRRGWILLRLAGGASASAAREAKAALAGGLGLLAFGLHAWVDYPFHIPANAMMAATLLGFMCRPLAAESQGNHIRKPF